MTVHYSPTASRASLSVPHPRSSTEVAAEYLRRSRARKERDRNASRQEQSEQIRREAKRRGDTITRTFDEGDGVGASRQSRKARPAWDAAMAALRSGEITRLYVYEMSRAEREGALAGVVHELVEVLAPKGRILIVVDEDVDSTDREAIIKLAEDARKETEKLSTRVRRTKLRRKRDGFWLGAPPPYGIAAEHDEDGDPTGAILRDPATWPMARRIAEAVLGIGQPDGKPMTLRAVALMLTAEGVPPPGLDRTEHAEHSGRWSPEAISCMVKSPTWAGLQTADRRRSDADGGGWHQQPDVYIDDDGQPVALLGGEEARVVTPAERLRILAILEARTRASGRRNGVAHGGGHVSTTLLGGSDGVLRCDLCGGRMVSDGHGARGHNRKASLGYKCAGIRDKRCIGTTVPRQPLDGWVMQTVTAMIYAAADDSSLWVEFSGMLGAKLAPDAAGHRQAAESAVAAAREVVERIKRLAVSGVLDEADAAREMTTAKAKLAQAERDLAATPAAGVTRGQAETWLADVESLTLPERRALIRMALREVRVLKVGLSGAKLARHISERVTVTPTRGAVGAGDGAWSRFDHRPVTRNVKGRVQSAKAV